MTVSPRGREWRRFALVALIAAAVTILFQWRNLLGGFDDFYYDAWHQVSGPRRPAQHVADRPRGILRRSNGEMREQPGPAS